MRSGQGYLVDTKYLEDKLKRSPESLKKLKMQQELAEMGANYKRRIISPGGLSGDS